MKRGIFFVIAAFSFWGVLVTTAFAGFGITPPYVRSDTLRPGSEYTQEIIIVRSDPVEDLNAELTTNLPGIDAWFSFDRGMKFILPKGESQVRLSVTVRVPGDAKLGQYNGNIRIRTYAAAGPETGVSLALGAQIDVRLKIVEEIYDFAVRRVEIFEAEEGHKKWWLDFPGKIKFVATIENTGNIPAAPQAIKLDIYEPSGQQLLESAENSNTLVQTLPFATKRVEAYLPTHLSPGGYRVKYTILKDEETVAQEGELSLGILSEGTISDYEGYGLEGLSLGDKLSLGIPAGLIIILILWIGFAGKKKRKRRPRLPERSRDVDEEDDEDDYEPPRRPRVIARARPSVGSGVVDLSRRR